MSCYYDWKTVARPVDLLSSYKGEFFYCGKMGSLLYVNYKQSRKHAARSKSKA